MNHISSYSTVYQIGHRAIKDIFQDEVTIEEKIDGSQFSFGVINGELSCRSKGKDIILDAPEKMFEKAIQTAIKLKPLLREGWIYRGEYLQKPKHNTLVYGRVPEKNIIIFDISTDVEAYLPTKEKQKEAMRIGLECVHCFFVGEVTDFETFKGFLEKTSQLGNTTIEGIVAKNYSLFTQEKKVAMGKYVSEAFKEVHDKDWKKRNPTGKDIVAEIILKYKTEARWNKAIQHLKERGELDGSPKDIGNLLKEVALDTKNECADEIKEVLFAHFWKNISRGVTAGLPEWYKDELAKKAFE